MAPTALVPARNASDFSLEELAARFEKSPGGISEPLRYVVDGVELAFLVIDWWPNDPPSLYELYVATQARGRGVGTAALIEAEEHVRRRGYTRLQLRPRPLDGSWSVEDLEGWYRRRGYRPVPDSVDDMFFKDLEFVDS